MAVVQVSLIVLALVLACPVVVLMIEVTAACLPLRPRRRERGVVRPTCAILVPAHNEVAGLPATISSLQSQIASGDRLIVIADNCTDATARVAADLACEVLERHDAMRRGKGFALAFGLDHLLAAPPEVVAFFDADCRISEGALDRLVSEAAETGRPVQSLYLCEPKRASGAQMMSSFAFRFKNHVRMLGVSRLGGPSHLTGSGMALPWQLVDKVAWATGNVVEDMQLGIDFTFAGTPPKFLPDAVTLSELPKTDRGLFAQRRRWEHGFLATAMEQAPRMIGQAIERRSWPLFAMALDLCVPPLALLAAVLATGWALTLMAWLGGLGAWPLAILSAAIASLFGSVLLGWAVHCRQALPLHQLLAAPQYVLAKLPLYVEFLTRREKQWVRAERPGA
jgi:cellulose synthase/poly-beta-1,6-N-acetylglucosamine synthase-like glycosyltransferase